MAVEESVLRRVRALLAKARHSAATTSDELRNEAETSLNLAQALMAEHGLSETMVEFKSGRERPELHVNPDDMTEEEGFRAKSRTRWDTGIAHAAATACGCSTYLHGVREAGTGTWLNNIVFYGLPQDIAVARELFAWMREALSRAVRQFLRERRADQPWITASGMEARSFRDGFVRGVCEAATAGVERQRRSTEPVRARQRDGGAPDSPNALVVLTGQIVKAREDALETFKSRLGLRPARSSSVLRDPEAYSSGRQAGAGLDLSRTAMR